MPVSRKRNKPSPALAGIPGKVLAISPKDWDPKRRAAWCRAYIAGAASPTGSLPPIHREQRWAFQQGQRESATSQDAVRQTAHLDATRRGRRDKHERNREFVGMDVISRLDRMMDPHQDHRILAFAETALNMVGGTLVPTRKEGR